MKAVTSIYDGEITITCNSIAVISQSNIRWVAKIKGENTSEDRQHLISTRFVRINNIKEMSFTQLFSDVISGQITNAHEHEMTY